MRLWNLPILLSMLFAGSAWGQGIAAVAGAAPATEAPAQAGDGKPAGPQVIALSALPARADDDERFASSVVMRAAAGDPLAVLGPRLQAIADSVDGKNRQISPAQLRTLPILRLESLARHWNFDARQFTGWRSDYRAATDPYTTDAGDLSVRLADWRATRVALPPGSLPAALSSRIDDVTADLVKAEQALSAPLAAQIELGRRANQLEAGIQAGQQAVTAAITEIDRRLWSLDAPPLWRASSLPDQDGVPAISKGLQLETGFLKQYGAANLPNQRLLNLMQVLLLPLLLWLAVRRRRRLRRAGADAGSGEVESRALQRPVSCWILLSMLGVMVFEPDAPLLLQQFAMIVALVPVLRLIPVRGKRLLGGWPWLGTLFYLLLRGSFLLLGSSLLYRWYQLALAALMLACIGWLLWRAHRVAQADAPLGRVAHAVRLIAIAGAVLLGVSILCNVLGNVSLAEMLVAGVIDSGYMALLLYAAFSVFRALLHELASHRIGARLRQVRFQDGSLLALLVRGLAMAAVAGWVVFTMQRLRVYRPVYSFFESVLTHRFTYGELSISLGDVVVFGLSVFVVFWVATLVRVLLREDLLSRMSLPRGVGNSIASLSYYALLMGGLFASLSVAGFKVGQLSLLFGALGVGIGLGLQDVVKNFVSGLILMFERPVQPGDSVEVSGTSGHVREIGMRATVVRTFDGADVVVPNGMLLSEKLINWTLHDRSTRIEVNVGVAYGSDAGQVAALLAKVARETPRVAADPPPVVLFRELAESSLAFTVRAWTRTFEDAWSVRSDLVGRIYEALNAAGIGIPFPQRDLNLRGLPEELRQALVRGPGADPGGGQAPPAQA